MANEYLKRTPTSTGNQRVFTWAGWVKLNYNSSNNILFSSGNSSSVSPYETRLLVSNSFKWNTTINGNGGGVGFDFVFSPVARDSANWIHVLFVVNTSNSNANDRSILYLNGIRLTALDSTGNLASHIINSITNVNTLGQLATIGAASYSSTGYVKTEYSDVFFIDGQALTPDVFGFYKDGNGYISAGSTQVTDFRPGQWVPKTPRIIKAQIERNGGFGVNGFYLPMNDSSNFGADFHTTPNSIITLKGEDLPQPRNGAPTTTDAYVSQLRTDPYAANLVLAVPGISTSTSANLVSNGTFDTSTTGWTAVQATISAVNGNLRIVPNASVNGGVYQVITTEVGKRYTAAMEVIAAGASWARLHVGTSTNIDSADKYTYTNSTSVQNVGVGRYTVSFTPSTTSTVIWLEVGGGTQTQIDFDNVVVRQEDVPRDYSAFIKGSGTNKTLTANGNAGVGYNIPSYYGSALSFDGSDDYIDLGTNTDYEFGSGNFTIEFWRNKSRNSSTESYVSRLDSAGGSTTSAFWFGAVNNVDGFYWYEGSTNRSISTPSIITTNQWDHLAAVRNGTTITLYLNGTAVGVSTGATYSINAGTAKLRIGGDDVSGSTYDYKGYIQDLRVYKGVAKYKGGFDVPRPYTPVGIATWRAVPDTTANNFATMNPLIGATQRSGSINSTIVTYTDGNLTTRNNASGGWAPQMQSHSNVGMTTGKWYWEVSNFSTTNNEVFGISKGNEQGSPTGNGTGIESLISFNSPVGTIYIGGQSDTTGSITPASGTISDVPGNPISSTSDVVGFAFDAINSSLSVYLNGVLNNTVTNIVPTQRSVGLPWVATKTASGSGTASGMSWNFGQNPTFSGNTTAGTFTDSNGKGLFKYQPPSGFLALCEDNLPTPAIKNPGEHFKTVLWTGDGNNGRSIVGVGFTPDLVWIKSRNATGFHQLMDSVRGAGIQIYSNSTSAESAGLYQNSFDRDGFSVSYNSSGATNNSGTTYAAWCWRAGAGTTTANTDGTIPSVVSVNQDAGFSIVSYTGNGVSGATVGHGLGKKPAFMVFKQRNQSDGWIIYHQSINATKFLQWDTDAAGSLSTFLNDTEPTSSVFSLGSLTNANDDGWPIISYCWAEIEGFSKFGSYVGNLNNDGPFVYCGFKPAFVMIKWVDGTADWVIQDSSRTSTNPSTKALVPSSNGIELDASSLSVDFLSNGFKIRNINASYNNTSTYIFAAFAESPFTTANAK